MKRKTFSRVLVLAISLAISTPDRATRADIKTPLFEEAFSFSLGDYWWENHLSVGDVDGDRRRDMVLMATARSGTNGPPWQYQSRAILLRTGTNGTFTDSVISNYPNQFPASLARRARIESLPRGLAGHGKQCGSS